MMDNLTRRVFLQRMSVFGVMGTVVLGCGDQNDNGSSPEITRTPGTESPEKSMEQFRCMNVEGLTDSEIASRTTFQYTDMSTEAGKNCANCTLYRAPETGAGCGTCITVKGPIHPKGYCTIWAARTG